MMEELYENSKAKLIRIMQKDPKQYKQLVEQLILQSLIKLMEVNVQLRCRKSDVPVVYEVMPKAIAAYKKKMSSEVKAFEGKDVPLKL